MAIAVFPRRLPLRMMVSILILYLCMLEARIHSKSEGTFCSSTCVNSDQIFLSSAKITVSHIPAQTHIPTQVQFKHKHTSQHRHITLHENIPKHTHVLTRTYTFQHKYTSRHKPDPYTNTHSTTDTHPK